MDREEVSHSSSSDSGDIGSKGRFIGGVVGCSRDVSGGGGR